jgi:hypothetical protein
MAVRLALRIASSRLDGSAGFTTSNEETSDHSNEVRLEDRNTRKERVFLDAEGKVKSFRGVYPSKQMAVWT